MSSYSSIKRQEIHKNRNKNFHLKKYFKTQNLATQNDELRAHLKNKENLQFLINERSIKLLQEAEELKVSKEKLEEHTGRLQETVEELGRRNYYLGQEGRVLRGLVGDYEGQNRFLKSFVLMVFILDQLVVGLYLLGLFDGNNVCVTMVSEVYTRQSHDFVSNFLALI